MLTVDRELRPMGIGDVLDSSLELYKRNFKKVTLLTIILYVPFTLLLTAFTTYIYGDFMDVLGIYGEAPEAEESMNVFYSILAFYFSIFGAGILGIIYNTLLKPVFDAAITRTIYDDILGLPPKGIRQLLKESFRKFPALLINKILYQLITYAITYGCIIGVYILMIPLFLFLAFSAAAAEPSAAVIIVAIVILAAIIIALLIFIAWIYIKYAFGVQAIVIENKSGIEALSRSSRLTRKNFRHIAFTYLFGYLLSFMMPSLITAGSYVLIYINKDLYMLASTGAQVVGAIFYPFLITLLTMLFVSLKVKKEGFDLELKVDMLLENRKKEIDGLNSQV